MCDVDGVDDVGGVDEVVELGDAMPGLDGEG